ncbi:unnamed protein product [Polarella glacialis]|uniref:Uncharacterized protein n=1 Tax=Polarella glacialis TaxID=89957 RepID=A0A813JDN4_POLGL|nr:unnamed protein product [Polarella glacialis]CAE8674281.1 unnamed protein product [Polarella glacialis]|mmetsp:Transcript_99188/g.179154  ORF Transcript_99188/g.179154 Transcript_99188/m.179154 type:complete len:254 (-) Transcript_99188:22-783(-)
MPGAFPDYRLFLRPPCTCLLATCTVAASVAAFNKEQTNKPLPSTIDADMASSHRPARRRLSWAIVVVLALSAAASWHFQSKLPAAALLSRGKEVSPDPTTSSEDGSGVEGHSGLLPQPRRRFGATAPPLLAAMMGFTIALFVVGPSITAGPMTTLPPGLALLLGQMVLLLRPGSFVVSVAVALLGFPLAHLCLLIPSGMLQYALPGVVGPAAGLLAALLLGGERALELCYPMVGMLVLAHGACLLRILKMGGW